MSNETVEIKLDNGIVFSVRTKFTTFDKMSILNNTVQEVVNNGLYNPLTPSVYFPLLIIFQMTDLPSKLDSEYGQKDTYKIFDEWNENGTIEKVISVFDPKEIKQLEDLVDVYVKTVIDKQNGVTMAVEQIVNSLPQAIQYIADGLKDVDISKLNEIVEANKMLNS